MFNMPFGNHEISYFIAGRARNWATCKVSQMVWTKTHISTGEIQFTFVSIYQITPG